MQRGDIRRWKGEIRITVPELQRTMFGDKPMTVRVTQRAVMQALKLGESAYKRTHLWTETDDQLQLDPKSRTLTIIGYGTLDMGEAP